MLYTTNRFGDEITVDNDLNLIVNGDLIKHQKIEDIISNPDLINDVKKPYAILFYIDVKQNNLKFW